MYYALQFRDDPFDPARPYNAYPTREEAEEAAEVHRQCGDEPEVLELPGRVILPVRYGEGKRIES